MPTSYLSALRGLSRNVRLVLIAAALQGFAVSGIYGVLLNLFLLRLGHGPEYVGLVNGTGMLASALFCIPASAAGRRFGCRRTMVAGLVLVLLGYAALPVSQLLPLALAPVALIVAYLTASLGNALKGVNVSPYLMAAARPEARSHAFSLQHAISPAAAFLGSLAGGLLPSFLAGRMGMDLTGPAPYGIALLLGALGMAPAITVLLAAEDVEGTRARPVRMAVPTSTGSRMPLTVMLIMAALIMVRVAGDRSISTYFNVYMDNDLGLSTAGIGTIAAIGQLLAIPAALLAPLLTTRLGNAKAYSITALGMAVVLLPLSLIPSWPAAAFSYVGLTSLISLARPAVTVHQQSLVAPEWRSTMAAVTQIGVSIGAAGVAYLGGYLASAAGYRPVFLMGSALVAAGAGLFWLYFRVPRGELSREARTAVPAADPPAG